MLILLLLNAMGANVHNQRDVLIQPILMVKEVEAYNLREMFTLPRLSPMV